MSRMSTGSAAASLEAGEIPILQGAEEDGPIERVTLKYPSGRRQKSGKALCCHLARQTAMGLPTRLDSRQELQHCRQQPRVFFSVCETVARDVRVVPVFQSPWPIYSSSSVLSSSPARSSGRIGSSSSSSVWKRSSASSHTPVESGETQSVEQLWEEYFSNPTQWWDNRVDKRNARSPDFKHKVTRKALWVDGWSTPPWVKARLKLMIEDKLRSHAGYRRSDSQDTAQSSRLPKGINEIGSPVPSSSGECRPVVGGGLDGMRLRSARSTTEAVTFLKNRVEQGLAVDSYTYVDVLKRCLKEPHLAATKQVHDCIIASGMEQNTYVANNLLRVYIRCGRLPDARQVFDALVKKDVYSWNIMIGGYAQQCRAQDAMDVLDQMRQEGVRPTAVTYSSILKAFVSPSALTSGQAIHALIRHAGLESDVHVGTALVQMYAKCGSVKEARQAFEDVSRHNVISWTVMIGVYAESGCGVEAYEIFLQMQKERCVPNAVTFMSLLNPSASAGALQWVKEVHRHAVEAGLDSDLRVGNALVHMYAKSGSVDDARHVFDRMKERDVISWTVLIGAYADGGRGAEAHPLFLQMVREGFPPDAITYMRILDACASAGSLEWVTEVDSCAREAGLGSDLRVVNVLIHSYSKCGSVDDARRVFERMKERDVITWNVMIGAYADGGGGAEAHALFLQMVEEGFTPDAITYMRTLNACASAGVLEWAQQVHRCAQEGGLESDLRVGNVLVHSYAKIGSMADAQRVFESMKKRDVVTWTVMIGAYADHGCGAEAHRLFFQMKREGFRPDAITYTRLLTAFSDASALEWVKEVDCVAVEAGLVSDLRVGNALVRAYAKTGSVGCARLAFDRMEKRDVITWNVMIGAYAEGCCGVEAHQLLLQMKQEGFKPDASTFMRILHASAIVGDVEWVKEVHSHILEAGLESDLRVGPALLHIYAKLGRVADARQLFDQMEARDVMTWSAMIGAYAESGHGVEAYNLFVQMQRAGCAPNAITFLSLLNPCASTGALDWVKEVDRHVVDSGLASDLRVGSALVHMYAKSGSIDDARRVFDRMDERNVTTWTVMIGAFAEHGRGRQAYDLFLQMQQQGLTPDAFTYTSILNPCSSREALEWVKDVHRHALKSGLESDLRVGNALVHMYAKSGSIDDARLVFNRMGERDVITWTVMIGGLAQHGFGREAYDLFLQMEQEGSNPDAYTCTSILNPCASAGALEWVKAVHRYAVKVGLESDLRVGNALVHMYAKSGCIDDAQLVFDRMEHRDVISWNMMIGAYAESGSGVEAYELFLRMQREGFNPDAFTYASILNASAGALEWVKDVHSRALKAGLESDLRLGNALVHMYAKSGSIDDARLVFDRMDKRDVITWTVMIGGLAQHGCGREALDVFKEMNAVGVKPDAYSFVAVLSACSHGGFVDEGRQLFLAMSSVYGIEPSVVHCTCMVDLLGRAGHLEEAKVFIGNMPVEPNGATWGALLGACRTYGNVELGELSAKECFKLEPTDASAFVLLSNIYAAAGKWEAVVWVRTMMQERGIRKEPGRSWIEVDNKVHDFVVGDTSHPETKEIYAELNRLSAQIRADGYVPDTRLVLRNIDEKEKAVALCSHSEKLAIAYGLLRTPHGEPIRVYKNLRVCSDCHTATKFISKVTQREIVARDASRFHHFKDGLCSCGDYW